MSKKAPPQMIRRISGFKIHRKKGKEGVEIQHEHSYVDQFGSIVKVQTPGQFYGVKPHEDLMNLWHQLSVHYAALTDREEPTLETFDDKAVVESFVEEFPISSIQWKTGKEYDGVQFHGYKKLATGHACNALTRLVKFDGSEAENYPLWEHLETLSNAINTEVDALLNGKHAKPAQQSITDPEQAVNAGAGDDDEENG